MFTSDVTFGSLRSLRHTAPDKFPYRIDPTLLGGDPLSDHAISHATDGSFLRVPPSVKVKLPFFTYYSLDATSSGIHYQTVVVLEEGSEATLYQSFSQAPQDTVTRNDQAFSSGLLQVVLKKGATLNLICIQDLPFYCDAFEKAHILLESSSQLNFLSFALGGKQTQLHARIELQGEGAHAAWTSSAALSRSDQYHLNAHISHRTGDTESEFDYYSVMEDHSKSAFEGTLEIHPDAIRSKAHQKNHNLLLDPQAQAISLPQLKIATDDVSCSHGSTTSSLNEEALYYLRSRGIEPSEARKLLVLGFLERVFCQMPNNLSENGLQDLKESLLSRVERKLFS